MTDPKPSLRLLFAYWHWHWTVRNWWRDRNAALGGCEHCGSFWQLSKAPVRTAYANQEQPQPRVCGVCLIEWNKHWDEMWREYYSSQGVGW